MGKRKYARDFRDHIVDLIACGYTNPQVAEELNLTVSQVSNYARRELGGNSNYLRGKKKHAHLHEEILKAKINLGESELAEKFGLTMSELRSCLTCAYKRPEFAHIRKDKRRRDAWSAKELRFLLRWSGIIPRADIAKHLKRGRGSIVVKEKLQQLGLCSKNVNGLTLSQFTSLFKAEPEYVLETIAGSPASKFTQYANWKIVPWCHIREMLQSKKIECVEAVKVYIDTMAIFQEWVHGRDYWRSLTSTPSFSGTSWRVE